MSIMDQVKKNLREWYSLAADRTGEMAKISVRMYDKYGISREIERQLTELGSYVYHQHGEGQTDFAADATFQTAIERVQELEADLTAKMNEIETIRLQRQQKAAAPPPGDDQPDGDESVALPPVGESGQDADQPERDTRDTAAAVTPAAAQEKALPDDDGDAIPAAPTARRARKKSDEPIPDQEA